MHADQPDLARRIVDELAGTMPATTHLADITDDQLTAVGQLAVQRRKDDQTVIGQIAAEYVQHRKKSWRETADMFGMNHMTLYRWAQPFRGSN
jgi:hypothetical protein